MTVCPHMCVHIEMKRTHDLANLVIEIVEESKAKDTDGTPLYPVMHEPIVLGFFGAPDALLEVLKDRPIAMLNLLQTNKVLEEFWNQFERAWILWTDMLIENEMGTYVAEIYAFFVVHHHRKWEDAPIDANFIGYRNNTTEKNDLYFSYINTMSIKGVSDHVFYVVYHDELTRLVMAIVEELKDFPYQLDLQEDRLRSDISL